MPRLKRHKFIALAENTLDRYMRDTPKFLAIDTETTGLTWSDRPFGVSVSWRRDDGQLESGYFEVEKDKCADLARMLLAPSWAVADHTWLMYNAKFDLRMLVNHGLIEWEPHKWKFVDVMALTALKDPGGILKLKHCARQYLGATTNEATAIKIARKELGLNMDSGYWPLPREVVIPYAMKDTEFTLRLYERLWPYVENATPGASGRDWREAFEKMNALTIELLHMEFAGLQVVPDKVKEGIRHCDPLILQARKTIEELVGMPVGKGAETRRVPTGELYKNGNMKHRTEKIPEFNPDSPPQLLAVFKQRGFKLESTGADILTQLDDPLANQILELRKWGKLRNTYLTPMLKEKDAQDIVHPNINGIGATGTGRTSSGAAKEM